MNFKLLFSTLAITLFSVIGMQASFPVVKTVTTQTTQVSAVDEEVEEVLTSPAAAADRKTVSIILALVSVILLPFGLHNWYLGRKKQALWQTLLVIPGFILLVPPLVSWVWQIVDTIRIVSNDSKFD